MTYKELDDHSLARQAKNNPAMFSEIYERYEKRVYRYLLIRTRHEQDAQDLTAQTFIKAWENIHKYKPTGSLAGWLMAIARHTMLDHFRKHKIIYTLDTADDVASQQLSVHETVSQKLELERVQEVLKTLAPERAEALSLRIFGELSAKEIAEILDKSPDAVKMLIHRGWQDLRQKLAIAHVGKRENS